MYCVNKRRTSGLELIKCSFTSLSQPFVIRAGKSSLGIKLYHIALATRQPNLCPFVCKPTWIFSSFPSLYTSKYWASLMTQLALIPSIRLFFRGHKRPLLDSCPYFPNQWSSWIPWGLRKSRLRSRDQRASAKSIQKLCGFYSKYGLYCNLGRWGRAFMRIVLLIELRIFLFFGSSDDLLWSNPVCLHTRQA